MSTVYEIKIPIDKLDSISEIRLSKNIPEVKTALNSIYGIDAGLSYGRSVETLTETMKRLNERTALGKLNRNKNEMIDKIKNVIFNNPATIVFWADGTKTVVKCENEDFDPEKGLAMAIVKKTMADNHSYYNEIFKKWLPKEEPVATLGDLFTNKKKGCEFKLDATKRTDSLDLSKYFPKGRKGTDGYPTEKE